MKTQFSLLEETSMDVCWRVQALYLTNHLWCRLTTWNGDPVHLPSTAVSNMADHAAEQSDEGT